MEPQTGCLPLVIVLMVLMLLVPVSATVSGPTEPQVSPIVIEVPSASPSP